MDSRSSLVGRVFRKDRWPREYRSTPRVSANHIRNHMKAFRRFIDSDLFAEGPIFYIGRHRPGWEARTTSRGNTHFWHAHGQHEPCGAAAAAVVARWPHRENLILTAGSRVDSLKATHNASRVASHSALAGLRALFIAATSSALSRASDFLFTSWRHGESSTFSISHCPK